MPPALSRAAEEVNRLHQLRLVATIQILQSAINPTIGSGDVVLEYQGRHMTASVLLEPQFVGRDCVQGYLALTALDHQAAPPGAQPALQTAGGPHYRYIARVLGIVEVVGGHEPPFVSCLADFGGLTMLLELSRIERVAFQSVIMGTGVLALRRA